MVHLSPTACSTNRLIRASNDQKVVFFHKIVNILELCSSSIGDSGLALDFASFRNKVRFVINLQDLHQKLEQAYLGSDPRI